MVSHLRSRIYTPAPLLTNVSLSEGGGGGGGHYNSSILQGGGGGALVRHKLDSISTFTVEVFHLVHSEDLIVSYF